jgi:Flagellar hook capping protein
MTINTNNTTGTTGSGNATGQASKAASAGGMTQSDFLKLMTAQLQAQDPTNPVDNNQFVSQMASSASCSRARTWSVR